MFTKAHGSMGDGQWKPFGCSHPAQQSRNAEAGRDLHRKFGDVTVQIIPFFKKIYAGGMVGGFVGFKWEINVCSLLVMTSLMVYRIRNKC